MRLFVGDDVRLDVAEGRIRLVFDAIVEGLDDVFLEALRPGMGLDDRRALDVAVFVISEAEDVHFDTRGKECDNRMHVRRNPGRGVESDCRPDGIDVGCGDVVSLQEGACSICPIDLEALVRAAVPRR